MSAPLGLEVDNGLATIRLDREHGNAINPELVDALTTTFRGVGEDPGVRGVMLAAAGKLFSPGLDLQELILLDREAMTGFLKRFVDCILTLYTFEKPVVAAMHGHAVAGGCVLSLTADWRVLRRGALVGLNEVMVGVPFPYGVSMILRDVVPGPKLAEVVLLGKNFRDEEALDVGLVHELAPPDAFEEICRSRLDELAGKDPTAFAITKRYLRSPTAERIRKHDLDRVEEFVTSWFSAETRSRVRAIVDQLRSRG